VTFFYSIFYLDGMQIHTYFNENGTLLCIKDDPTLHKQHIDQLLFNVI